MRTLAALLFGLVLATSASAHFVFINVRDITWVQIYFSDTLQPDKDVPITKIAKTKAFVCLQGGKATPVELEKVKDVEAYNLKVPESNWDLVYAITEYDVISKGDAKPYLLRYFSKSYIFPTGTNKIANVGDPLAVELGVKIAAQKIQFRFLAGGKPVPDAEVNILYTERGGKASKASTDKDGWTPSEDVQAGRYAVWAKQVTPKAGEFNGKKYEEVRDYATFSVHVGAGAFPPPKP
jgi:uncharacterized GH25 family protein